MKTTRKVNCPNGTHQTGYKIKKGRSESSNIDSQIKALVEQNKTLTSKVDSLVQYQASHLDMVTEGSGLSTTNPLS